MSRHTEQQILFVGKEDYCIYVESLQHEEVKRDDADASCKEYPPNSYR